MKKHEVLFFISTALIASILFIGILLPQAEAYFKGEASIYFTSIVEWLYPRLTIEKERFDATIFLGRAKQIFFKFILLWILLAILRYSMHKYPKFRIAILRPFKIALSTYQENNLRYLFAFLSLLYTLSWYEMLQSYAHLLPFYEPIGILKLLQIPYPNTLGIAIFCSLIWGSCLWLFLGLAYRAGAAAIISLLFILGQAWLYSFGKLNHTYSTWQYLLMIFVFVLWSSKPHHKAFYWALMRLSLMLAYTLAGLEKLWVSHGMWAHNGTLQAALEAASTPISLWLSTQNWLCIVISWIVLLFELFFVIAFWKEKCLPFFVLMAISFHLAIYFVMDIGHYSSPWIASHLIWVVYAFQNKPHFIKNNG